MFKKSEKSNHTCLWYRNCKLTSQNTFRGLLLTPTKQHISLSDWNSKIIYLSVKVDIVKRFLKKTTF